MLLFIKHLVISSSKYQEKILGFAATKRGASRLFGWSKHNLRGDAPDGYLCLNGPTLEHLSESGIKSICFTEDQTRTIKTGKAWVCRYHFIGYD